MRCWVDDGSEEPRTLAALDAVEAEFAERGWRVVTPGEPICRSRAATPPPRRGSGRVAVVSR